MKSHLLMLLRLRLASIKLYKDHCLNTIGFTKFQCLFQPYVRGIPDYDYEIGTLRFIRNSRPATAREETPVEPFQAFKGEGFTLRTAKSKN